jgi:anti-sigma B factor antagonist
MGGVGIVTDRAFGLRILRPETSYLDSDGDRGSWQVLDQALTMRVRRKPGYLTITVAGEIDFATVSRLKSRLLPLAAAGCPLVVDLNLVSFIDAAGLGALASAARRAAVHGTSLHVVCARRQIRRLFRITGLDLPLAGTLAEALQVLPDGPPLASATGGAEAV